jgi:hypothetical protein
MENPSRFPDAPPDPDWLDKSETEPRKKDHPVWGVLIALILCATLLLAIQMILDYHW